jgi:tetratricopeptide (TPR) repeat protein
VGTDAAGRAADVTAGARAFGLGGMLARGGVRAALLACAAIGVALTSVPLLGVQGVESAVALGALVPLFAAGLGARCAAAARGAEQQVSAAKLAGTAVALGAACLAAPMSVLWLNALRVRNCAPLEGLMFMLLGPGAGVVLAALLGACVGAWLQRPRLATALAVLVPLGDALRAAYDFYASPAVFAYGHFFGYFPGALYDELVQLPMPLITLRVVTAALCGALWCLLLAHYDPSARRLRVARQPGHGAASAVLVLAALLAAAGFAYTEPLGHRTSVAFIADALGGRVQSRRCELLVPREMRGQKRQRYADDCDFRVAQLERWFGVTQRERVRVIVFRSADEKRRLMGAADTNIAKPWRHEIYLQDDAWPHSVLPHEMAHIIAGNTGKGLLHVTGKLFGLLPDFALVEGTAVAAAWPSSASAGLTPHQWSRAMLELGIAPSLKSVFGAGFLNQQRRLAYTLSGSLLRYIADTHGAAALRRVYRTGDVQGALGMPLSTLEQRFHAFLRTVDLPPAALALAKQRFSGSSVLSSVCPHEKAVLKQDLEGDLAAGDLSGAERACAKLLAIDPNETLVRATRVAILARDGDVAGAERELQKLASPPAAAASVIAGARQALADEAFRDHRFDQAAAIYEALLAQPNDRDALRQLQVKSLALRGSPRERALIFALLIGEPGLPVDGAYAVYLARELRGERSDGLPHYLEARQLLMRERYAEAAALLAQARALTLPTPEIELEALRGEGLARFALGELDRAQAIWQTLAQPDNAPAQQAEAADWLARIAFARARGPAVTGATSAPAP